jgi:HAMP domain-containing protein
MSEYITLIFRADDLGEHERRSLTDRSVCASWSHAIDDRKLAEEKIEQQAAEIERLNSALKKQAAAAKSGMNAAKQVSSYQLEEAKRLRAESSPEALESERAANARMTDEIERLQAEIERLRADFADARSCAKVWELEMQRARADERTAMHYLGQIRKAVAPDVDFPTLVRMCGEIQAQTVDTLIDMSEGATIHQWRIAAKSYANQLRAKASEA